MSPFFEAIVNGALWGALAAMPAFALWPLFARLFPATVAWGAARLLAPALVTYLAIVPSTYLGVTRFTSLRLAVVTLLAGVVTWLVVKKDAARLPKQSEWKSFEIFHGAFFLAFCLLLPYLGGFQSLGERVRDVAIWNAALTQRTFPIDDPWLAGVRIPYYVFGYFQQATIALWTGLGGMATYLLALAATGTAYASALFLLFRAMGLAALPATGGALAVALAGNGKCAVQAAGALFGTAYDWWAPSRAIQDTITEFPLWTMTLGDLHPHFLMLPFFPLLLVALAVFALPRQGKGREPELRRPIGFALTMGMLLAWFQGGNTWEVPVALAAVCGGLLLRWRELGWRGVATIGGGTVAAFVLFAVPFVVRGSHVGRSFGIVAVHSTAAEILLVWGPFLLPVVAAIVLRWWRSEHREWIWGLALMTVVAFAIGSGPLLVVLLLMLLGLAMWWEKDGEAATAWRLGFFGLCFVLFCEVLHLRDVYGEQLARLNTVFKFYMPTWAILGAAAVLATLELRRRMPERAWRVAAAGWAVVLSAHVALGLWARTGGFSRPDSMSGMASMEAESGDDANLARWMIEEARDGHLDGVVLEEPGGAYSTHLRLSSISGLKAYAGWEGYGYWPIYALEKEFQARVATARGIYDGSTGDCAELADRLRRAGIDFVAIGAHERRKYQAPSLERLQACFELVHREGDSMLLAAGEPAGEQGHEGHEHEGHEHGREPATPGR